MKNLLLNRKYIFFLEDGLPGAIGPTFLLCAASEELSFGTCHLYRLMEGLVCVVCAVSCACAELNVFPASSGSHSRCFGSFSADSSMGKCPLKMESLNSSG